MPKVYEYRGIKFYIFPGDHEPSHVHIFKAGEFRIKMDIEDDTYKVMWATIKIQQKLLRNFRTIINKNKRKLILKWQQYGNNTS